MLVRLFGKNFRSLRDPFELSMVAADLPHDGKRGVIEVPIKGSDEPLRLLRVVALYGPNASGKSSVITAAESLHYLGARSSWFAGSEEPIRPYNPFALDDETSNAPVELGCEVVHDGGVLQYQLTFKERAITSERLTWSTEDEVRTLIDREDNKVTGDLITSNAANALYVEGIQPNVTALSKLGQHGPREGEGSAYACFGSVEAALRFRTYAPAALPGDLAIEHQTRKAFHDNAEYRRWVVQQLLRPADLGIEDVDVRRVDFDLPPRMREGLQLIGPSQSVPKDEYVIHFRHQGKSPGLIPLDCQSAGTQKMFYMSREWHQLMHTSMTLFADELGAGLHPVLLDRLVRAVNEGKNPAQLVFASHEASLLEGRDGEPPALRRDQVYFVEKDHEGASKVYSLAEFKGEARNVHNLRKRYMSGLYGAIPSVGGVSQ